MLIFLHFLDPVKNLSACDFLPTSLYDFVSISTCNNTLSSNNLNVQSLILFPVFFVGISLFTGLVSCSITCIGAVIFLYCCAPVISVLGPTLGRHGNGEW